MFSLIWRSFALIKYVEAYGNLKRYYELECDAKTVHNLIRGDADYSLKSQYDYANSEVLQESIKSSVRAYTRNKDIAISIYKDFCKYLQSKGVAIEVKFPPIGKKIASVHF